MGLFTSSIENAPERVLLEDGERYTFQVNKATIGSTKGQEETEEIVGKPQRPALNLILSCKEVSNSYPIFLGLYFPVKGDEQETIDIMNEQNKKHLLGLGYDSEIHGDFDLKEWKPGMTEIDLPLFKKLSGRAIVSIVPPGDKNFRDEPINTIRRWVSDEEE